MPALSIAKRMVDMLISSQAVAALGGRRGTTCYVPFRGSLPLCGLTPLTQRPVTLLCGSAVGGQVWGRGAIPTTYYS